MSDQCLSSPSMFDRFPAWENLFTKFKKEGVSLLDNPDFLQHVQTNVMNALTMVVDNLDNEAHVKSKLYELGTRHTARNVKREHFTAVTGLLIDTLKAKHGIDAPTQAAWQQLLDVTMDIMSDGEEGK